MEFENALNVVDTVLKYEYFLIFLIVIMGQSIVTLTGGIASYLKNNSRHSGRIEPSATLSIWVFVLLVGVFQHFLALNHIIEDEINSSFALATNISIAILMFLICRFLVPDFNAPDVQLCFEGKNQKYSLPDYFDRHRRTLAWLGTLLFLVYAANYILIWEGGVKGYFKNMLPYHLIFLVFFAGIALLKRDRKYFWPLQTGMAIIALSLAIYLCIRYIPMSNNGTQTVATKTSLVCSGDLDYCQELSVRITSAGWDCTTYEDRVECWKNAD